MADELKDVVEGLTKQLEQQRADGESEFNDVRAFQTKFDLPRAETPRLLPREHLIERFNFLNEELTEFRVALEAGDLAGIADALIDIVYVAKGTAVMMGLPWRELWNDVQRANMAKVKLEGLANYKKNVGKPEGWVGPKTEEILIEALARTDAGQLAIKHVLEQACCINDHTKVEVVCPECKWTRQSSELK